MSMMMMKKNPLCSLCTKATTMPAMGLRQMMTMTKSKLQLGWTKMTTT